MNHHSLPDLRAALWVHSLSRRNLAGIAAVSKELSRSRELTFAGDADAVEPGFLQRKKMGSQRLAGCKPGLLLPSN